jgi:tetratricopeptide (TPR) repeat protein
VTSCIRRRHRVIQLALAITLLATGCGAEDQAAHNPADDDPVATAERQRIKEFWATFREATQLRLDGKFEEALATYERALEMDPAHEDALYYLGNVHLELENWTEARGAWLRLTETNSASSRAFSQLGTLAMCRPGVPVFDLSDARSAIERAHELNPEETGPTLRLGQVALLEARPDVAVVHFKDVIGSNHTSLEAFYLKAYADWIAGRGDEGLAELNEALDKIDALPSAPLPGEGDTKTGRTLGPSDEAGCPLFDPFLSAMSGVERPFDASTSAIFDELSAVLAGAVQP